MDVLKLEEWRGVMPVEVDGVVYELRCRTVGEYLGHKEDTEKLPVMMDDAAVFFEAKMGMPAGMLISADKKMLDILANFYLFGTEPEKKVTGKK